MGGVKFDTITSVALQLGDNQFEQGIINVAANTTIKGGTILKRGTSGKFEVATNTPPDPGNPAAGGGWTTPPSPGDILIAVMPFDLENDKSTAADMGFRALIGGSVRRDQVNLNGSPIDDTQVDALRNYGIIAVKTTDISYTP
jgi:hypothetical protein